MKNLYNQHPNLLMWAALALGMVAVLLVAARDVGFTTGQWAALLGAPIALAGLCVWIISWESDA
jgi:drug/metabolite transporter (DMT)-like permease